MEVFKMRYLDLSLVGYKNISLTYKFHYLRKMRDFKYIFSSFFLKLIFNKKLSFFRNSQIYMSIFLV